MEMSDKKTILVVDDEPMIRESVFAYFSARGYHVLTADNGPKALDFLQREPILFVILDLMLPGMSGEQVCQEIRKQSRVPILMLTAKSQEDDILNGLSIGADAYMTKPFRVKELHARMEAILRRTSEELRPLSEAYEWGEDLKIDFVSNEVRKNGEVVKLTKSEWKILSVFVKYPKKVFSRTELIDLVFDTDFDGYDRVIDTHIKNLRKKIESDPKNPVYIKTVHGIGYRFGGDAA